MSQPRQRVKERHGPIAAGAQRGWCETSCCGDLAAATAESTGNRTEA